MLPAGNHVIPGCHPTTCQNKQTETKVKPKLLQGKRFQCLTEFTHTDVSVLSMFQ